MIKLIDFYADWCGPCRMMKPIFAEVETEYAGKVEFEKVDVEANNAMAAQFGIHSIPTFVIMKEDVEVSRKQGAMSKEILTSWLDEYLE